MLTNHIGYENAKIKQAVILIEEKSSITSFSVVDVSTGKTIYTGATKFVGYNNLEYGISAVLNIPMLPAGSRMELLQT